MDNIYINRVLSGDIDAFKYFVKNYKDFAFSLSYSILKNHYLAEESVQESFIIAFDKLNTFRQTASFKTWFGRIVINISLRKVNKKVEYHNIKEIADIEIADIESSIESLLENERKFFISQVFEQLTFEESLTLELYYSTFASRIKS